MSLGVYPWLWTTLMPLGLVVFGRSLTRIGVVDVLSDYQSQYLLRLSSTQPEVPELLITWNNVDMDEYFQIQQKVLGFRNASVDIILVCQSGIGIWDAMMPNKSSRAIDIFTPETVFMFTGNDAAHFTSSTLVFEDNKLGIDTYRSKISSSMYTSSVLETTRNITNTLQWRSVAIIYDEDAASMVEELTKNLNKDGIFVMSYLERDVNVARGNHWTLLDDIYDSFDEKGINITVICNVHCVQRVLNQANSFDHMSIHKHQTAMRQRSKWFIITSAPDLDRDVGAYCYDLDNVAVFNLYQCGESLSTNVKMPSLLDIDSIQHMPSASKTFSTGGVNITLPHHTFSRIMEEFVEEVNGVPLCTTCSIYTLIWVKKGGKIRTMKDSRDRRSFQPVGHVNISGVRTLYADVFPNVNFHFNGREFLTTTNWWPPFMDRYEVNGTRVYFGFCQDMLDELASQLNFTYVMTEPADKEWGFMLDNGSWTGMIGELQREEVDMMIAPASIQAGREMVMDFTHPYYFDTSTILMKRPDPNKTKWRTLIEPFADIVHMCIWITLSLAALVLAVLEKINPFYRHQEVQEEDHQTYQNAFWYMFGALLTQGGDRLPESQTGRTLISFWWLFSIIMVATYSGNLIAFLTVAKDRLPFNSVAELVAQSEYSWGTLGGTYFITMFKDSTLPVYLKVWDGVVKANASDPRALSPDPAIHIQKILKEDYVYFGDKVVMDMRRVNDCRLTTVDEEIPNMSYGVGLPNHSPYTKIFSNKILELLESGIFSIYTHRHWPKVNYCKETVQATAKQISLIDVHSAFILIGIGIAFGSLVLLAEFIVRYRYKLFSCVIPQKTKDRHVASKKFRNCRAVFIDGREKPEPDLTRRRKSSIFRLGEGGNKTEKTKKSSSIDVNDKGNYV
ncbi:uncharacterized protein [Argopecten irradians]|uniref:uncharacterized protein n=1 Tax=Argopecten irradians TaxID=31199 RepID=UPI00371DA44D